MMNLKQCDRCNNPATHFLRITLNGQTRESALCAECAAKETREDAFTPFFDTTSFFALTPLFARREPLDTRENKFAKSEKQAEQGEKPIVPLQKQDEKSLATLKAELKRALRKEDYLTAASIRDSIRTLEGK